MMREQGRIGKQSKYDRVRDREVINKRSTHSLYSYGINDNVWAYSATFSLYYSSG